MSIRAEWQKLVSDGELFRLEPLDGDPSSRTVLLSPEMQELVSREMEEGEEANRRARLLNTLQSIVAGRRLVVCMTPFGARDAVIGRLAPTEKSVFDIRCQDKPAVRVFCCFVERDVLFAVTCRPRSEKMDWLGWLPLGDRNSNEWKKGIAEVLRVWARFFPTESRVSGDNLDEYLSNARLEQPRSGS